MRYLFFIGILFFIYSCSENKANSVDYSTKNDKVDSVYFDTIFKVPYYDYLFDSTLADGFIYPVIWKSKSNDNQFSFKTKFVKDTLIDSNYYSEIFYFNPKWRDKLEVVMPADGFLFNYDHGTNGGYKVDLFFHFIENGKYVSQAISIIGLDTLYQIITEPAGSLFIKKNTVIGTISKVKYKGNPSVKISYFSNGKSEHPFYSGLPNEFFKTYKSCMLPANLDKLVFACKHDYKMYYFEKGELKSEYTIGLSQSPKGHKQKQGDNKLPEGMYRITEKSRGPFYGETGPWLGVAWMQFSYPNQYDAINGYNNGTISLAEKNAIVSADKNLKPTNSYTELGGRVGIHGWNGDWIPNGTQNLTWGCITMFNRDIDVLYDKLPINTYIIIVP